MWSGNPDHTNKEAIVYYILQGRVVCVPYGISKYGYSCTLNCIVYGLLPLKECQELDLSAPFQLLFGVSELSDRSSLLQHLIKGDLHFQHFSDLF